jgi:hypothetical protein
LAFILRLLVLVASAATHVAETRARSADGRTKGRAAPVAIQPSDSSASSSDDAFAVSSSDDVDVDDDEVVPNPDSSRLRRFVRTVSLGDDFKLQLRRIQVEVQCYIEAKGDESRAVKLYERSLRGLFLETTGFITNTSRRQDMLSACCGLSLSALNDHLKDLVDKFDEHFEKEVTKENKAKKQ